MKKNSLVVLFFFTFLGLFAENGGKKLVAVKVDVAAAGDKGVEKNILDVLFNFVNQQYRAVDAAELTGGGVRSSDILYMTEQRGADLVLTGSVSRLSSNWYISLKLFSGAQEGFIAEEEYSLRLTGLLLSPEEEFQKLSSSLQGVLRSVFSRDSFDGPGSFSVDTSFGMVLGVIDLLDGSEYYTCEKRYIMSKAGILYHLTDLYTLGFSLGAFSALPDGEGINQSAYPFWGFQLMTGNKSKSFAFSLEAIFALSAADELIINDGSTPVPYISTGVYYRNFFSKFGVYARSNVAFYHFELGYSWSIDRKGL